MKILRIPLFVATAFLVTASLAAQAPSTQDQGAQAPSAQAPSAPAPSTPAPSTDRPSTQAPGSAAPSRSASANDKKVTISGCVARQPESTSAAANAPSIFMLNNAAAGGSAPVGTSGASAAASKTYRLDGTDAMLSPHVGHKIEVTGTVDQASSPAASAATEAGASASASSAPKLKVDSVKMVSATCQ